MDIIRHDDGSLTVPVVAGRHDDDGLVGDEAAESAAAAANSVMVLRPGEGGYVEALTEWEAQQHPDRGDAVSTASGREQAMAVVHAVAEDREHVAEAVESLDDAEAGGDALRHVLIGGTPAVQAFAAEVAEAEGGEPLPTHTATRIIGEVLAEIDAHPS